MTGVDPKNSFQEHLNRKPFVTIEDGEYVFDDREVPGHLYSFTTDRVQSLLDVMRWIAHLSEKCWIQKEHLTEFSELAVSELGLELYAAHE